MTAGAFAGDKILSGKRRVGVQDAMQVYICYGRDCTCSALLYAVHMDHDGVSSHKVCLAAGRKRLANT